MARSALLSSSIAKKYWMALTGLFLCLFLVGHLLGNLQLFIPGIDGKTQFNLYAHFMTTNPAVKILSYLTYFSILFHTVDGILILTVQNQKARKQRYAYNRPDKNSIWSSRNMGILGTIVLVFIVTHMTNFWAKMHFSEMPMQTIDGVEYKDLYTIVIDFFQNGGAGLGFTLFYAISMAFMGFHLWHGFGSAFQTIGLGNGWLKSSLERFGKFFSVFVPLLFAIIPLYIRFLM